MDESGATTREGCVVAPFSEKMESDLPINEFARSAFGARHVRLERVICAAR